MLENKINVISEVISSISDYMIQVKKGKRIAEISKQLNELKNAPTAILVCGEFKRGKSTFINALIGRNVCPTDTDICTSVVSIIKYGANEKATRIYGDFSNLKQEVVPFDDIEQYTVGTAEKIGNTICMELEMPLDELKKGLVIIDTPGVGGLDPRHATLTNYFLPQADVTLFMTDVNEPLTTTELDFYKNKVLQYAKHSAIIVNKADLKDEQAVEEIRQDTVNKVAVYTQTEAEALDVLSVSSADCIREEDNLGNFPKVRKLIERLVNEHRTDNLEVICEDLSEQIELAIIPLQAQINQIEKPDVNQIETFNKKKNEINQKLNDLSNPQSDLRISINKKIDSERQTILMNLNKACVDLSTTEFNKLLENPLATSDSRWLGQQVYDRIDELSTEITLQLNKAFERIASIKEFEGLLNYRAQKYQGQFTIKDVDLSVPIHRQITAGMTGYGIAIAGLAFLSGIGTIAALATAAYVSTRQIKDVGRGKRESELRQTYQPQIQTETQNFRIFVEGRFNEFQRELFHTISNKAQEYRDSYNEALNNMQTIRQQINAAVTQQQQLKQQLNPLVKAKESIDALEF